MRFDKKSVNNGNCALSSIFSKILVELLKSKVQIILFTLFNDKTLIYDIGNWKTRMDILTRSHM